MHKFGIFHPDFFYHPRTAVESAMIIDVEIYKPTGADSEWTPGVGMANNMYQLVWTGKARVQPDKDWRARAREAAGEYTAVQAVRIQVGIGKNTFTGPAASEAFEKDYLVRVVDTHVIGTGEMIANRYIVRNALNSGNKWVHNLLCDAQTKLEID